MARPRVYNRAHTDLCREKIKTGMLLKRLQGIALGEITDATPQSVKALEIALRKTCPDLQSIEHVGDVQSFVVQVPETLSQSDWAAKYAGPAPAQPKPDTTH